MAGRRMHQARHGRADRTVDGLEADDGGGEGEGRAGGVGSRRKPRQPLPMPTIRAFRQHHRPDRHHQIQNIMSLNAVPNHHSNARGVIDQINYEMLT